MRDAAQPFISLADRSQFIKSQDKLFKEEQAKKGGVSAVSQC